MRLTLSLAKRLVPEGRSQASGGDLLDQFFVKNQPAFALGFRHPGSRLPVCHGKGPSLEVGPFLKLMALLPKDNACPLGDVGDIRASGQKRIEIP